MLPTAERWRASPRILSEQLAPLDPPLALLLRPGGSADPAAVAARAARALLDLPEVAPQAWPAWLAPHQVPAARRLHAIIAHYGGAVLADAVGLGKSYVALAVALARREPFGLVVPAVLVPQWRALLDRHEAAAQVLTHESLSRSSHRPTVRPTVRLFVVDEAHRFRNPETNRYGALARLVVGARVLLVTATPVHNRLADLLHLFHLFVRDDALAALGLPSLKRAARSETSDELLAAAAPRLVVARSRERVRGGYTRGSPAVVFPTRARGEVIRAGTAPEAELTRLVAGVARLRSGGPAAALCRLTLLRRLASSGPAFRGSLAGYEAFLEIAREAARAGRALTPREFARLFPRDEADDLQLVLLPLLLPPGETSLAADDRALIAELRERSAPALDPKAAALEALLAARDGKTIVFCDAVATVRYLARRIAARRRVAAVTGETGWFGGERVRRAEVLGAFAPRAQGSADPPPALATDVLIATDLLSEGLNLQDAVRVAHYDLPWSPARLAQRVGRIDRLGSHHARIETVTFLPAGPLAEALALERRLVAKGRMQRAAGAAQLENLSGGTNAPGGLDWCDRLHVLAGPAAPAPAGSVAAVEGDETLVVMVVRIGELAEAIVVDGRGARADPDAATRALARATTVAPCGDGRRSLERAIEHAAPLVRARVAAIQEARWRAADRDRLARRLIPWVLASARRAAKRGDGTAVAELDGLVARLSCGMTAGEELLLEERLAQREPLTIGDLLAWHRRLPPIAEPGEAPRPELIAALVVGPAADAPPSTCPGSRECPTIGRPVSPRA
ncbi:MAG: helicase-related protein [Gemmatimonadales bacterium]